MAWLKRGFVLILVIGISAVLLKPFCHLLFQCGCQSVFGNGSRFCNIHTAAVPHCPWCSTGQAGAILPKALIWISQAAVVLLPRKISYVSRFLLGILGFLIAGSLIGLLFGLWTHYPIFLIHR